MKPQPKRPAPAFLRRLFGFDQLPKIYRALIAEAPCSQGREALLKQPEEVLVSAS